MSVGAGQIPHSGGQRDLVPLDQLIRDTPGAHPITSIGELRNGAFETDEELDAFLAFVTESRHADLAYQQPLATLNLEDFKDFAEHHGLRLLEPSPAT